MDELDELRLLIEWGCDEALGVDAVDRLGANGTDRIDRTERDASPAFRHGRNAPADRRTANDAAGRPAPAVRRGDAAAVAAALASAAHDLAGVERAIDGFELCPLKHTAGALVFADGPADAKLVVIADAPSAADDETGLPLSGATGAFLHRMLGSVAIGRDDVRATCLVPWRPPGDRPPSALEIATCLPFLLAHLRFLSPRCLVLLGTAAARAVAGAEGTTRQLAFTWRDVAPPFAACALPTLILPAPLAIAKDGRMKRAAWGAMLSLRARLDGSHTTA